MSNYAYINLDDPLARPGSTIPYGINDAGQVVGWYVDPVTGGVHGFLFNPGNPKHLFTTLDDPLARASGDTFATGINDVGQVVGYYYPENAGPRGFVYNTATKAFVTLPESPLGAVHPLGINDSGVISGYIENNTGDYPFVYSGGTYNMINLPTGSYAWGINDAGQVVGAYGFGADAYVYGNGSITNLPDFHLNSTFPRDINNDGTIVGEGGSVGFVYSNGQYTTLTGASDAFGINDWGQIVGGTTDGSHGYIAWSNFGIDYRYTTASEPLAPADIAAATGGGFVGEYLGTASKSYLTEAKADALINAGLQIFSIYEIGKMANQAYYLHNSFANGERVGEAAYKAALLDGQGAHPGSAIYFGIDFDPGSNQATLDGIADFFRGISAGFSAVANGPSEFTIGVYGAGVTLSEIKDDLGLATYGWLAGATGWTGSSQYTNWDIKQIFNIVGNFASHGKWGIADSAYLFPSAPHDFKSISYLAADITDGSFGGWGGVAPAASTTLVSMQDSVSSPNTSFAPKTALAENDHDQFVFNSFKNSSDVALNQHDTHSFEDFAVDSHNNSSDVALNQHDTHSFEDFAVDSHNNVAQLAAHWGHWHV